MSEEQPEQPRPADRVPPPPPRQPDMALIGYLERANRSGDGTRPERRRRWPFGGRRDERQA